MPGRIIYCALPTRLRHISEQVRQASRNQGYAPVIPFDIGPFEDFEGGSIGRMRTIDFMIHVMRFCDLVGIFGISKGVLGELNGALDANQEVKIFYDFDPEFYTQYEALKVEYKDPFQRLRSPNHLITLVGPSAVGKTFWSDYLTTHFSARLQRVRNTTTRQPRNEADQLSYNFISKYDFERGIKENCFLEYDCYLGNYYGSSLTNIRSVLKKSCGIFAITPEGAKALYRRRLEINLTIIRLVPASVEVLHKNLQRRGIIDPAKQRELISLAQTFQLPPEVEHRVVEVNGEMDTDEHKITNMVESIITHR